MITKSRCSLLLVLAISLAGVASAGTFSSSMFTDTSGLDLDGYFPLAYNNHGGAIVLGDASFQADNNTYFAGSNFNSSSSLVGPVNSIVAGGEYTGSSLSTTLPVIAGESYRLQLLFHDPSIGNPVDHRPMDVIITNDVEVDTLDNFNVMELQGQTHANAVVVSYDFVSGASSLDVNLSTVGNGGSDTNAFINSFSLEEVRDDPRVWLRLGETSDTIATDSSPVDGTQNGTYNGSPTFGETGIPGAHADSAVRFDGVDDYVQVVDDPVGDYTAYSLEAWVKFDDPVAQDDQSIFVRTNETGWPGEHSHELSLKNGSFEHRVWHGAEGLVVGTTSAVADQWYHVVATAENGGEMRLYVNGLEEGSAKTIGTAWNGGDRWRIGSDNPIEGVSWLDGVLDEVAIYDYALTAGTVRANYLAGITIPEPTTLLIWSLLAGLGIGLGWRRRK